MSSLLFSDVKEKKKKKKQFHILSVGMSETVGMSDCWYSLGANDDVCFITRLKALKRLAVLRYGQKATGQINGRP